MWFMCRHCLYRINSKDITQTRVRGYLNNTALCPVCDTQGNEMFPSMCMLLTPEITKIERNKLIPKEMRP